MRFDRSFLLACGILPALLACPAKTPPPIVLTPAKVKSFTATPAEVHTGETTTLRWEVENATSLSLRTDDGQAVELPAPSLPSGTLELQVAHNTLFMLTARGEGGSDQAVASVAVSGEAKVPLLVAIPSRVHAGESATLAWNCPGASQVELRDGAGQPIPTSGEKAGSIEVSPDFTSTWTLVADGLEKSATVQVLPTVLAFQSDAAAVAAGAPVSLSWRVGGAESVTLSTADRGVLVSTTDPAKIADGSFADTVPNTLPANGSVEYVLEATAGSTSTTSKVTVYAGADPVLVAFASPEFVKPNVEFPVSWKTELADRVEIAVEGTVVYRATTDAQAHEGSTVLAGVGAASSVEIRASNVRGGKVSQSRMASPVGTPVLNGFTPNPTAVAHGGEKLTLAWNVTNARHVKLSTANGTLLYEATGASVETGAFELYPNKSAEYVLEADNTVGEAISPASITANVTSPARLVFSPNGVPYGTSINLTGSTAVNGGDLYATKVVLKNLAGAQFVDIGGTGTLLPFALHDETAARLIHFQQPFFAQWGGLRVGGSNLSVSVDGWMVFSDSEQPGPSYMPWQLPTSMFEPNALMVFGSDLAIDPTSRVLWQVDQVGGQRRLIVQWDDMASSYYTLRRSTFQAQLYENGEVVFAYKSFPGWPDWDHGLIGIISPDETTALAPTYDQLEYSGRPTEGSTLHFFGRLPLPYPMTATTKTTTVSVDIGGGHRLLVEDAPTIVP